MMSTNERYSKWCRASLKWAIGSGLLGILLIILNISTSATVTYAQVVSSQTPTITPTNTQTSSPNNGVLLTLTVSPTGTPPLTLDETQPYPGPEHTDSEDQSGLDGLVTPGFVESPTQATQTALDSSQQGATATLIPFPTVTIIFPHTKTVPPLITPDQANSNAGGASLSSLSRVWPIGLLISTWLALVAWFYFSHRHHD